MPVLYHYLDHDLFSCVHNRVGSSKLLTYFQGCSFYLQLHNGPKMTSFCLTRKIILLGSIMANFEFFMSMKDTIYISSFLDCNQEIRVSTSDVFELKFPKLSRAELKRFQAKPSWGISIFELKPSWIFLCTSKNFPILNLYHCYKQF